MARTAMTAAPATNPTARSRAPDFAPIPSASPSASQKPHSTYGQAHEQPQQAPPDPFRGGRRRLSRREIELGARESFHMAQKVTVQLVDDLHGLPIPDGAGRTVQFGYDGATYEIDLRTELADELRNVLAAHVAARKVGGSSRSAVASRPAASTLAGDDLPPIPRWAPEKRLHRVGLWPHRRRGSPRLRDVALTSTGATPPDQECSATGRCAPQPAPNPTHLFTLFLYGIGLRLAS